MKAFLTMCLTVCVCCVLCCEEGPGGPDDAGTGVLVYSQRMGEVMAKAAMPAAVTGRILDTRSDRLKIEVSTGAVVDSAIDNNTWVVIYDSDEKARSLDRVFAPVTLAAGNYTSLRLTMNADSVTWVCAFDQDTVDLPCQTMDVSVFSNGGLFAYVNGNRFTSIAPQERIGGFEVRAGGTTYLTYVSNFHTIDWADADSSGAWSSGDIVDNETTVPGAQTMCDFVVNYQ